MAVLGGAVALASQGASGARTQTTLGDGADMAAGSKGAPQSPRTHFWLWEEGLEVPQCLSGCFVGSRDGRGGGAELPGKGWS